MDIKLSTLELLEFMLILILLTEIYTPSASEAKIMCKDNEREALLTLKQGLIDPYGNLSSSWGHGTSNNNECCEWWGVTCSNNTGHVIDLVISDLRGEISPSLLELRRLNMLVLTGNDFMGAKVPDFIGGLGKLEYLILRRNNFSGEVPYQLGNLTNLMELDLSNNKLTSNDLTWLSNFALLDSLTLYRNQFAGPISWLSNLTSLSELDLSWNSFSGSVPDLISFNSLRQLDLRNNELTNLPTSISNLSSLSTLDLSYNQFQGSLQWILNLTSLTELDLNANFFTGEIPDLKSFSSLTVLYLSYNKLTGQLPQSIGQLSNLEVLDVSLNSLVGTVSDVHLSELHKLDDLNICFNSLSLNLNPDWVPPFHLSYIFLAGCNIRPQFPTWLETQRDFIVLDLSANFISDEVPHWLWHLSDQIGNLNLSHNNMSGLVSDLSSNFVYGSILDISNNKFYGPLPLLPPNPFTMQLSYNKFSGTIRSICSARKYDQLQVLDLSSNQLSGELPDCWEKMSELEVLSLANNNFSGHLPRSFGSVTSLQILNFRNNRVSGKLPSTLKNCSNLVLIDGGKNELTGTIPTWLGAVSGIKFLSLRHNSIHGKIPPEICHSSSIQVLDLSVNNISGSIPNCFQNFTSLVNGSAERTDPQTDSELLHEFMGFVENAIVEWKQQESQYKHPLQLLMLIDLSSNKLTGSIPPQLSLLSGLVSLNLSRNYLTGHVNSDIDQMKMLETLDFSRNRLTGVIPEGLAELNFLAVLDLSSNNLSGKIPKSTQLQSFDASAYAGNNQLCGAPLLNCRGDDEPRPSATNRGSQSDSDEGLDLNQSLVMDYVVSAVFVYVVGFWFVIGPLIFKRSWRNAYFGYLGKIGDCLYLAVTSWTKVHQVD